MGAKINNYEMAAGGYRSGIKPKKEMIIFSQCIGCKNFIAENSKENTGNFEGIGYEEVKYETRKRR